MKLKVQITNLITGIVFIILGILSIVFKDALIQIIGIIAGSILIVCGVLTLIIGLYTSHFAISSLGTTIIGILMICFGFVFCFNADLIATLVPLFALIYLIFNGLNKLSQAFTLKRKEYKYWWVTLVFGIVYIVIGISLFFILDSLKDALPVLIGILFIVLGISYIIDYILKVMSANKINKVIDKVANDRNSYNNTNSVNNSSNKKTSIDNKDVIDAEIIDEKEDK